MTWPVAPRARVAWLRLFLYGFVVADVLLANRWVARHGTVPRGLYRPLLLARLLHLPDPTRRWVLTVEVLLLTAAVIAASGRLPRAAGAAAFALYLGWMLIAFSYGKVDHDRFAFLVALAVLPTAGPAHVGDTNADEAAGWAVHTIQWAVVATYVLSAAAKARFGGLGWVNSTTLLRAVLRRGTFLATPLAHHPELLHAAQWFIVAFELTSPLLLVRGPIGRLFVVIAVLFHLVVFSTISIIFLPHLLCLLAFLPLERVTERSGSRAEWCSPSTTGVTRTT
jgi:hypothetical protein